MNFNTNTQIPVMEHFYTLQGEGKYSGTAAYFIRLAGCDVGCHWCDVKDSWTVTKNQLVKIDDLVKTIRQTPTQIVVITGGEPLLYNLTALCNALHLQNYRIHLETSGAYALSGNFDWICVSPKKFKPCLKSMLEIANELKVIVYNQSDFKFAEDNALLINSNCQLLLQPEESKQEKVLPSIITYIKENPKWQLSLQTHKYLNIP
ncbi:MAG: radical SAM protein [Chitinophagales bacterium]|nr:radical SAM protein [Chitinophagales bacterium]